MRSASAVLVLWFPSVQWLFILLRLFFVLLIFFRLLFFLLFLLLLFLLLLLLFVNLHTLQIE